MGGGGPPPPSPGGGGFNPSPPSLLLPPVRTDRRGAAREEDGFASLHLQTYDVEFAGGTHGRAGSAWDVGNAQRLLHRAIN